MGAFQSLEWAAAYPDVVERVVAVGGGAEFHAHTIGWSALWAEPIRLDPRWNGGNYYGRPEPVDGMRVALKIITLHARAPGWAGKSFGRKWAAPDKDPAAALEYRFAIEDTLEKLAAGRAALYDANAFLYLVKANQLFVVGGAKAMDDGLRAIKAPVLLIAATSDLIVFPEFVRATADALRKQGGRVEYAEIQGDGGHFDAILGVAQAAETIRTFLGR
jgi:homoserine O-acetyltransferase